ncbi:SAM-dependent methyltransferase [Alcaligenaceae bacterium A4P071]|nr:SAM-dependent methyltransferase [Alcaligenaceae bacterium A4P071]
MRKQANSLPELDPAVRAHSARTADALRGNIAAQGGWISFEQWMADALYAPGLGYYAAGNIKLADTDSPASLAGDFVTAPQLTPVFAQTWARCVAEVLHACAGRTVLEFGAGTGALAADMLDALDAMGVAADYRIIEVSADLKAVQHARLARFGNRVQWLDRLPDTFVGCVVANEVLDAMPVTVFGFDANGALEEHGVAVDQNDRFVWSPRPASAALQAHLAGRLPAMPGYVSEINVLGEQWIAAMGRWLTRGAALLIDYGFPQSEYYHPQRAGGTLMAHLRHHAHADVLLHPGVQDITAHVDFTAMAQAAIDHDLDVIGYTSQSRFLMNAGLPAVLQAYDPTDVAAYARVMGPVQKLVSEAEMGELFKVLAIGRGIDTPLTAFGTRDRRHTL